MNELSAVSEPTDAQNTEIATLRTKLTAGEKELRNALDAQDDEPMQNDGLTAEQREKRAIVDKSRVSRFFAHAVNGKALDGAEAEVGPAFDAAPGDIPIEMFESRTRESRTVTPVAAGNEDEVMNIVTPAIFARSAAAYLGVDMPTVATGVQAYPILSTSVTAGAVEKSAEAPATAGAFTVSDGQVRSACRAHSSFRSRTLRCSRSWNPRFARISSDVLTDAVQRLDHQRQVGVARR